MTIKSNILTYSEMCRIISSVALNEKLEAEERMVIIRDFIKELES